jgi:glutaryl-CoA dehydrogenase (non-decarboxylating)
MDFSLTDEQRLIQETVRDFVDERVLPVAVENDINHRLDLSLIEGMAELGILGIVIPEEYGGAGLDFVSEALSCEEIERGEAAFRTLISVHVGLNSLSLLKYASEEQRQRWLTPQAKGEKLACFGLTEPGAGSDVAAMRTTARREGDTYVLNGQKNWISYASVADHALVFAKTDPAAKHKGISAFLLEKGMKGFTTADTEHKLGVWAGSTGELFFENVEVPAENLIGEEGQGFEIAMYGLDQGRFTVAAGAVGVIRACLENSTRYANERETFGQPIGKYQFVQDMIAKMVLGYETSKLLVMQAAWMKDTGRRNTRETSLAKWHATESAFEAAHLAIQVFGSYGYSAEYGIERYFRNARAPIIYEGTTQIHKLMQAEHALGLRKLNGHTGEMAPLVAWRPYGAAAARGPIPTGA